MSEYLNTKALYRTYYIAVIALFVMSSFAEKLLIGEIGAGKVITAILVAAYIAFLISSANIVRLIMSTSALAAVAGAFLLGKEQVTNWAEGYVYALEHFSTVSMEQFPASYQYGQVFLVILAAGLVAFVMDRIVVLKYATALGIMVFLIIEMVRESEFGHLGTVFGITFVFTVILEIIQKNWKKRFKADIESYIVSLLPLVIAYMIVMLLMPNSDKPYDWRYTKGIYERICERIDTIHFNFGKKQEENYATSMAGFSDANKFFGDNSANQNIIMTVKGDSSLVSNLYLIGRSYDTFYGNGWSQNREETSQDRFLDTMETMYSIKNYDKDKISDYIVRSKINVKFGNYHSGYTFMPLKTIEYWSDAQKSLLYTDENLLTGTRRDYGDEYSFAYYQINMQPDRIAELIDEVGKIQDPDSWKALLGGYRIYSFGYDSKIRYDEQLKNDYSQEIILSDELKSWVENATGNAEGDYQKLKSLEAALNQFEYDINPGELPDTVKSGEDFLEYFILSSKRGYCTYFATAFTLLARAQGYPARYVEGFCVPVIDKTAKVTGSMAHAWTEVYFDGVGWIPFEPTPGYNELRYTSWEGNSIEKQKEAAREKYLELQEQMKQNLEENQTVDEEKNNSDRINQDMIIFICRLTGIILASIDFTIVLLLLLARWKFTRLSLTDKYLSKVNENLRLMSFIGVRRDINETFEEYKTRIDEMAHLNAIIDTEFLTDYEYVRYGNHEVTQEYLDRVCKVNARLKNNLFVSQPKKRKQKEGN